MAKIITGEKPLVIPPMLAASIGRSAATVLQQIHYWVGRVKEVKEDGLKWFHKTYKQWSEEIPFLSIGTIRRAITTLKDLNLIQTQRRCASDWWQANWYTINYEEVGKLSESICPKRSHPSAQNDRIDEIKTIASSIYTETTPQKTISTDTPPQPPSAAEEKEEKCSPTHEELQAAEKQLRECRINPAAVMREVLRQFANFQGAIARTKEAQQQGWCTNPTGVFLKALKLGLRPDSPSFPREKFEIPAPPEGLEDWAIAHSDSVKTIFFSSVNRCWMVVYCSGMQRTWSEAMGVKP